MNSFRTITDYSRPASRVIADYRCAVCGADRSSLVFPDRAFPEKLECGGCGFPYSLSRFRARAMPLAAHNDEICRNWRDVRESTHKDRRP